jgi:hypothetical protein
MRAFTRWWKTQPSWERPEKESQHYNPSRSQIHPKKAQAQTQAQARAQAQAQAQAQGGVPGGGAPPHKRTKSMVEDRALKADKRANQPAGRPRKGTYLT